MRPRAAARFGCIAARAQRFVTSSGLRARRISRRERRWPTPLWASQNPVKPEVERDDVPPLEVAQDAGASDLKSVGHIGGRETRQRAVWARKQRRVVSQSREQWMRQREHPLPERDRWQHVLTEIEGGVWHILRPKQEGQMPRPLHANATKCCSAHDAHLRRAKPRHSKRRRGSPRARAARTVAAPLRRSPPPPPRTASRRCRVRPRTASSFPGDGARSYPSAECRVPMRRAPPDGS